MYGLEHSRNSDDGRFSSPEVWGAVRMSHVGDSLWCCQEVRLDDSHCLQKQLSSTSVGHLPAECLINTCHEVCIYCPVVTCQYANRDTLNVWRVHSAWAFSPCCLCQRDRINHT